jgi:hypothetical protein
MAPNSPVFIDVDEFEMEPNVRRARSNGYLDYLKEQERWNRRDQERQMVRYRDRGHFGATEQRSGANRLAVPIYEVSPRRQRAKSDTRSPSRSFKTLEVRPEPQSVIAQEEFSESVTPDIRKQRGSTHSRVPVYERPKVKIPPVVVQEHPPDSKTPDKKSGKSPNASPRSPASQPQLQYKYLVLQNKFADIILACVRYINVEAANPRDLTFEKLSEQVKGFAFELRVWSHVANFQNMARSNITKDAKTVTDATSRNMDRLIERAEELHEACLEAKPGDLKFDSLPKIEDEETMFDTIDDDM